MTVREGLGRNAVRMHGAAGSGPFVLAMTYLRRYNSMIMYG